MTSAFCPHSLHLAVKPFSDPSPKSTLPPPVSWESETEDEEVKLNCVGGVRGMEEDSDMNTMASSDEEDDTSSDEEEDNAAMDRRVGVVTFVARLRPSPRIFKPRASRLPALSPPLEMDEDEVDDESSITSEVGARGVPLSLESDNEDAGDDNGVASETDEQSVSGSDADESDMEDPDDDHEDLHNDMDYEPCPMVPRGTPHPLTQQEGFKDLQENDSASVILQALALEEDREISNLIESSPEESDFSHLTRGAEGLYGRYEGHLIGAAQDREGLSLSSFPRVKRVLSLDETLLTQRDVWPANGGGSKRRRKSDVDECAFFSVDNQGKQDAELDGQLWQELESQASSGGDQSPVPLLTPPQSPIMGETCEWPSNLVVDSALTSVLTQELCPEVCSADTWVEEDEDDIEVKPSLSSCASTELTPLFRGIQVSPL